MLEVFEQRSSHLWVESLVEGLLLLDWQKQNLLLFVTQFVISRKKFFCCTVEVQRPTEENNYTLLRTHPFLIN